MKSFLVPRLAFILLVSVVAGCALNSADPVSDGGADNTPAKSEASASAVGGGGESQPAPAEILVAELYKQHDAKRSPFFQTKDRALVDKYFTKNLADLIWKDAVNSAGEVGALDADPLYDAQDVDIKNFRVASADIKSDKATVAVTFTKLGEKKALTYSLTLVKDSWKISDINYGRKETLITWLSSPPPETADDLPGEFEGKYLVGDTNGTVEFKNRGYAVRWAK
jgi:hypothetical protein